MKTVRTMAKEEMDKLRKMLPTVSAAFGSFNFEF